jgi:agmatine deiminase
MTATLLPDRPTPAEFGYAMPAEWAPHRATWVAWPHQRDDWPGKFEPVPWVYVEIIRHLARGERVLLVVRPEDDAAARAMLRRAGVDLSRIDFLHFPTDRVWLRDSGAIFVRDGKGQIAAIDWHFNAWAKYDNWQHDDALPERIASWLGVPRWRPHRAGRRVVLEGGSIEVNGEGLVLTTEECLLSDVQARNPGLSRGDVEAVLCAYLGARKVLWLGRGIVGDDTHGHIDDVARFVDRQTIVLAVEKDPVDDNHARSMDNVRRLEHVSSAPGVGPLRIVTLPFPRPVIMNGERLPASYANFYIANGVVLVPTFNDPNDRVALDTIAELMPSHRVVGIHSVDLVWGLGTLHCLTQQEPVSRNAETLRRGEQ